MCLSSSGLPRAASSSNKRRRTTDLIPSQPSSTSHVAELPSANSSCTAPESKREYVVRRLRKCATPSGICLARTSRKRALWKRMQTSFGSTAGSNQREIPIYRQEITCMEASEPTKDVPPVAGQTADSQIQTLDLRLCRHLSVSIAFKRGAPCKPSVGTFSAIRIAFSSPS